MMNALLKLVALLLLISSNGYASLNASFSALKSMENYQDKDAQDDSDPIRPAVTIGYNIHLTGPFVFSPQFFYSVGSKQSDDSYGGDYSVKTYGFLYDALYALNDSTALRFGIGNVIKSIKGEGGTVSVPNGSSTITAYKPEESDRSHTATLNFGIEFLSSSSLLSGLSKIGFRGEYLMMSPLQSDKRSGYLLISFTGYI